MVYNHNHMKPGVIRYFPQEVTLFETPEGWHHNPSICQDDKGHTWIATRHHDRLPLIVHLSPPTLPDEIRGEASRLIVARFDPKTLTSTEPHLISPEPDSPEYLRTHNLEDVRLFHRSDGLHGIGAAYSAEGITQVEVAIDYDKGTYRLIHNYGQPNGHTEKNWSPPAIPTPDFDFMYSPSQTVKDGYISGSHYEGSIHGGSQLLPYKDGWISIAHRILVVRDIAYRWYTSIAQLHDKTGFVTHNSQYFGWGVGWRPVLQESVEYVSGAIWLTPDKEMLLSLGVRDETCGFVKLPVSQLEWVPAGGHSQEFTLDPELMPWDIAYKQAPIIEPIVYVAYDGDKRCLNCGRFMQEVTPSHMKSHHVWRCSCMPKGHSLLIDVVK